MDHQIPVLLSPARFKVLACGRRWGKTASGMLACLRGHGPTRGTFRGAIDGGNIWWVAPDYPQIAKSKIWHYLKEATKDAWVDKSEIDRRVVLPGGGSITVCSAHEPDSLRGDGLDGLVFDEAAFAKDGVWQRALRPALADKQGWAILQSTPNGRNWFFDVFRAADKLPGWERWNRPSSDNPLFTKQEAESIRRDPKTGPRSFAQEYEARFLETAGAMWPATYFEDRIWCSDGWPERFELSVIAVDPSMGKDRREGDYSAIVFVGLTGGVLYVDSSILRRPPGEIVADTIGMWQRYSPGVVGIESNGFQGVLGQLFDLRCEQERLPPLPLSMVHNHEKKQVRIQRLDGYLANGKIRFRDNPFNRLLVEQLQMFPLKDYHDDGPDALEMAVRLLIHLARSQRDGEGLG